MSHIVQNHPESLPAEHHFGSAEDATLPGPTHAGHALKAAIIGALAVSLVLLAFIWPSITTTTKHLPVLVVGTAAQAEKVQQQAEGMDAGFEVTHVASRAEAETALKERKAYGAFVFASESSANLEVLTASAASPAAAQMVARAAQGLGQQAQKSFAGDQQAKAKNLAGLGAQAAAAQAAAKTLDGVLAQMRASVPAGAPQITALESRLAAAQKAAAGARADAAAAQKEMAATGVPSMKVTDVAALSPKDPRGTNLAMAGLPLTMGGMIGGILISFMLRGTRSRILGVLLYGMLAGLAIVLIMHTWFQVLQGNFFLEWLVSALSLGATAALLSGLQALIGQSGIALGAIITLFIGNPISSLSTPKEFLPEPWGQIGQLFVPGATGTILRDLSYFPEADTSMQWIVLAAWLVLGLGLSLLAAVRRAKHQAPAALKTAA